MIKQAGPGLTSVGPFHRLQGERFMNPCVFAEDPKSSVNGITAYAENESACFKKTGIYLETSRSRRPRSLKKSFQTFANAERKLTTAERALAIGGFKLVRGSPKNNRCISRRGR